MFKRLSFSDEVVGKIVSGVGDLIVCDSNGNPTILPLEQGVLVTDSSSSVGLKWADVVIGVSRFSYMSYCYRSSSQSLDANVETKILLNTVFIDNGNFFDSQNSRIVPTVAGKYLCLASVYLDLGTENVRKYCYCIVKKNGLVESRSYVIGYEDDPIIISHYLLCMSTGIISFNGSTDYIDLWALPAVNCSVFLDSFRSNFLILLGPIGD